MFPLFRFVGENYSNAQEAMEETMCSFYNQSSVQKPLSKPVVGQLVAVREEDGEEVTRAQVIELISPDKVKVMFIWLNVCVRTGGLVWGGCHIAAECSSLAAEN